MNKTRSLLVRFGALTVVLATALVVMAPADSHGQITVDGARDAAYGTPLTTQTVTSSWGAGNTLASLSVRQEGNKLYVFVAGRASGNSLVLFVDSKSGGANKLVSGLVSGGGEEWRINNFSVNGNSTTDGLTFETGFNADFAINVQSAGWTSLFPLDPASPKPRSYVGNMINDASIAGGPVTKGKQSTGVNVSNVDTHANGWEFEFDITALGVGNGEAEPVKFLALIITDGVNLSPNQVLGSLPNSADLGGWGSFQATNFETISGTQTVTAIVNNADADGDGIPNSTDTDDDNDGLLDTVETNTGVFVNSGDTGTNPLVADTDGDGVSDAAEVAAGKNPNKKNYASMLIAGDFLTPTWSDTANASNTMTQVIGQEFGWQIDRLFTTSTPIKFKFLAGSWSTNWGSSGAAGVASPNGGDISTTPGTGVFRFYFNTDTLGYSLTRATFATYTEYATAYGIVGSSTDDDDGDGLTNQQEFAANTNPSAPDSDGDGLSDASEINGSASTGNLGVAIPTNPLLADTDGDGLRDDWEISYFLDPTDDGSVVAYTNYIPGDIGLVITTNPNGGASDPDSDSLTNVQEFSAGSSPLAAGTGFVANNAKITVPGAFNGWNAEGTPANTMVLVGNFSWKSLLYFSAAPAEGRFKFAAGSWSKNWGSGPTPGIAVLEGGDIIGTGTFTAPGYYAVTFNDFSLAYTMAPVALADLDTDGLPDEYEAFYGGQLATPTTDLVPATDYNGDGKTTAQNYADGTNPVKDVVAPSVALAPGVDKVTWYALGATIPDPIASDVVATDDITTSPAVTILSPLPDNSINGFNTVIYQATDATGNYTLFRRIIAVGSAIPPYYNLRYPAELTVNTATSNSVYGEIYVDNATAGAGQATGVQAWVGVSTNNTDPSTWDSSAWTSANYVGEEGNNDNYAGVVSGVGRTPGTYYYATRFQLGTNSSNTNYFYGGITANGIDRGAWGTFFSTNTNTGTVTTNVYGNGVLTVQSSRLVSFAVDMNVQTNKALFNPATQGVEVRGSFGNWAGGYALTNSNNSGIYTGTFVVGGNEGSSVEYKFYRTGGTNSGFESLILVQGGNRTFTAGAEGVAQTTPTAYFGNDDGIGPVITVQGDNPVNLTVGQTYTEPGVTAEDAIDGFLAAIPDVAPDTSVAGTTVITYTASDASGNTTTATRTVIVSAGVTAPSGLSYTPSSAAGVVGTAITSMTPSVTGTVTTYSVDPALPAGLSLNTATGVISGTPTAVSASASYTVTAGNSAGSTTASVTISVVSSFDNWATQNGLSGVNAQPTADPDKDGFSNEKEFAFGGNPNTGNAGLLQFSRSGSDLVLVWLERTDAPADAYKVQSTTNMAVPFADDSGLAPSSSADQTGVPNGYARKQVNIPITGGRSFHRLRGWNGLYN